MRHRPSPLTVIHLAGHRLYRPAAEERSMPHHEAHALAHRLAAAAPHAVRALVCRLSRRPGLELEPSGRPERMRGVTRALAELLEDGQLALLHPPMGSAPGGASPGAKVPSRPSPRMPRPPELVLPRIDVAPIVLCAHDGFTPRRVALSLRADQPFDGEGELTCNRADVSLSRDRDLDESLEGPTWVFEGSSLSRGVTLYVRFASPSAAPDDITFTLTLRGGSKPVGPPDETTCTAVRGTIDLKTDARSLGGEQSVDAETKYQTRRLIARDNPFWHNAVDGPDDAAADETLPLSDDRWDHPRAALELRLEPAGLDAQVRLTAERTITLHTDATRIRNPENEENDFARWPWTSDASALPASLWLQGRRPGDATLQLEVVGYGVADIAKVTVANVKIRPSQETAWGYDEMNEVPGRVHHVSLPADGQTSLSVQAEGVALSRLHVSASPSHAIVPELDPETGTLVLRGAGVGAAMVQVRLEPHGPIVAAVVAHAYPKVSFSLAVCACFDPASPSTRFTLPPIDPESLRQRINEIMRPVVAEVSHLAVRPPRPMPFDPDGDGKCQLFGDHDPVDTLTLAPPEPGYDRTALVFKDLEAIFSIPGPLKKGEQEIQLGGQAGGLTEMTMFDLDNPKVREKVMRVSRQGQTIRLKSPLRHDYARPAQLFDAGGYGPRARRIILIDLGFDMAMLLAHELCHSTMGMHHVVDPHDGNIMNRWRREPPRIRYKRVPLMATKTGVPTPKEHIRQWDAAERDLL